MPIQVDELKSERIKTQQTEKLQLQNRDYESKPVETTQITQFEYKHNYESVNPYVTVRPNNADSSFNPTKSLDDALSKVEFKNQQPIKYVSVTPEPEHISAA